MKQVLPRDTSTIPVVWRDNPFGTDLHFLRVEGRMTIAQVAASLPPHISSRPIALVNDVPIPREMWHRVRLKAPTARNPIVVTFPAPLQGGSNGGSGTKKTIGAILGVAVLLASIVVAPYLSPTVATALGLSAPTALSLTQAALGIGGALLISALTPPPTAQGSTTNSIPDFQQASQSALQGNVLQPGAGVPRVLGTLKVFPPFGIPPLQEVVGDDTYVEAAYIMAGPHKWENICSDDVPLSQIPNVEYEIREGWNTDAALTLVTRQSKTNSTSVELSEPQTNTASGATRNFLDQTNPVVPVWHPARFTNSPDEAWVCLQWPTGLLDQNALLNTLLHPIRIRFRPVGASYWINCPEVWFASQKNAGFSKDIRFVWGTPPTLPVAPSNNGPVYAYSMTPMRVENVIGNLNNGPLLVIDGNMNAGGSVAVQVAWIGAAFPTARPISYVAIMPNNTSGLTGSGPDVCTINLWASNSAPAGSQSGTLLAQLTGVPTRDTSVRPILVSNDITTPWTYVWVEFIRAAGSASWTLWDISFYGGGDVYGWVSNSYFRNGNAVLNKVMYDQTNGDLKNIGLYSDRVEIYLDPASFPKGDYDVEIKRGSPIRSSLFEIRGYGSGSNANTSTGENLKYDMFTWNTVNGVKVVPQDVNGLYYKCVRSRTVHIWNEAPIVGHDLSVLAVRAKNQQLGQLTATLSGYTNDWDGSGWNTVKISSNPAPHLWQMFTDSNMNADPIPADLMDEDDILEWRQQCIDKNYQINAVVQDMTMIDVATIMTGCGYARLRPAEKWGVFMDRDRSAEGPVSVYSHKNLQGFHWDKAFPRLPDGFRTRWTDIDNNYQETEKIILRPGATDTGRYEDMRYEGLITEAEVRQRAVFDLRQLTARPVFYTGTTNFQHITNRRGDLVALQLDVLDRLGGSSYIVEVYSDDDSLITGLKLYGSVPIETGTPWGVAIRGLDGSLLIKQILDPGTTDEFKEIFFTNPFPDPGEDVLASGCLVASGVLGSEYRRVIVNSITPKEDTAEITFVDEAPELWGALTARQIIRQYGLDDSLVLCLDAGDGASYTSGQEWLDTSGEEINFFFGINAIT